MFIWEFETQTGIKFANIKAEFQPFSTKQSSNFEVHFSNKCLIHLVFKQM